MNPYEVRFFWSGSAFWFHLFLGFASATFAQSAGDRPKNSLNRPQRNNNPLNIKYGGATKRWVEQGLATIDPVSATDGGKFLKFRDVDTGFRAARDLLRSGVYRDLDLEAALRKWSGRGYGADIIPDLEGTQIGRLTDPELDRLIDAMAHREGFYAGGYKPPRGISPDQRELIEDVSRKVSEAFGGKPATTRRDGGRDGTQLATPAPHLTPPRPKSPLEPSVELLPAAPPAGKSDRVDPFHFLLPDGWTIAERRSDGGVTLGKGGVKSWPGYITFSRHPRMGTVPYTPEAIGRYIRRYSWEAGGGSVRTESMEVGKEKYRGLLMQRSGGGGVLEAVLFTHDGNV